MRGRRRITVLITWLVASCGAAALVGGALGALATSLGVPPAGPVAAAALLLGAAAADLAGLPAPSVRRQVPRIWGRILDPHVTAVLYGVRLGIGPATMLSTWLWWAATLVAASAGPAAGAVAGACFAAVRTAVHVAVAAQVEHLPVWQRRGRRITRGLELTALILGLTVVLTACSGDDAGPAPTSLPPTTQPAPSTTAGSPTTEAAVTTTPAEEDLGTVLPLELAGYERITDRPGADTALDLETAAALEVDPEAERALLETRGFRRGHTRAWRDTADRVVVATVHEFATPEDAALYLEDGMITLEGFAALPFDVPDTPGARGFTQDGQDGYRTQGVAFVRGNRWFLVYVNGPPETTTVDEAQRLARLVDPGA